MHMRTRVTIPSGGMWQSLVLHIEGCGYDLSRLHTSLLPLPSLLPFFQETRIAKLHVVLNAASCLIVVATLVVIGRPVFEIVGGDTVVSALSVQPSLKLAVRWGLP